VFIQGMRRIFSEVSSVIPKSTYEETFDLIEKEGFRGVSALIVPRNAGGAKMIVSYECRFDELHVKIGDGLVAEVFVKDSELNEALDHVKEILVGVMTQGIVVQQWVAGEEIVHARGKLGDGKRKLSFTSGTMFSRLFRQCQKQTVFYQPYGIPPI